MKIEKLNEDKLKITLSIDDLEERNITLHSFMRVLNTFEYFKILQALIMLYFFVNFFPKPLRKFAVSVIMCLEVYE